MSKIGNFKYTYTNWGPFLMKMKMPDYIIKRLKAEGLKCKTSYNKQLAGHLDNQFLYPESVQMWFYNEINPVLEAYRTGHSKFHGIENLPVEMRPEDLWVNYMKPGDFNPLHTHASDYSFVLFLDVPKKLEQEAKDFKGTSTAPGSLMFEFGVQLRPNWATTGVANKPKTGDFFMFPSLLQHWVCPFKSKVTRISVSGNISLVNRDKLPPKYF